MFTTGKTLGSLFANVDSDSGSELSKLEEQEEGGFGGLFSNVFRRSNGNQGQFGVQPMGTFEIEDSEPNQEKGRDGNSENGNRHMTVFPNRDQLPDINNLQVDESETKLLNKGFTMPANSKGPFLSGKSNQIVPISNAERKSITGPIFELNIGDKTTVNTTQLKDGDIKDQEIELPKNTPNEEAKDI